MAAVFAAMCMHMWNWLVKSLKSGSSKTKDLGVGAAFVGAIAVLLLIAGYVISRLSSEQAYREKWKDYNDCGWA